MGRRAWHALPSTLVVMQDPEVPGAAPPARRAWLPALAFAVGTGLLVGFAVIGIIAGPLFLWARATEPGVGLQRPFVRSGLRAAPLAGLVAFAVSAVVAGRWRLRHPPP